MTEVARQIDQENSQAYFFHLGLQIRTALKMHRENGLWQRNEEGDKKGDRSWGKVTEHCLAETARALVLAEKLGLSPDLQKDMELAAALHDFYKPNEVQLVNAEAAQGKPTWLAYEQSAQESATKMAEAGFSPQVILLAGSVSHTSLPKMAALLQKERLSDLETAQLALHFADDISSDSDWVQSVDAASTLNQLDRRFMKLESDPHYQSLNEEGKTHLQEGTFDAMRRIGHLVEARLADLISKKSGQQIANPLLLPEVIDAGVKQNIQEFPQVHSNS